MSDYTYNLGFAVNNIPIPDPTEFSGETADLDLSGERDTTGMLHRNRVAQKVPVSLRYANIGWDMCQTILQALNSEKFRFTYPDPNTGRLRTGTYYAGNRKWDAVMMHSPEERRVNLTVSIIEY